MFACRQAAHSAASCSYSPAGSQPARRQQRQRTRLRAQAELGDARPVNPDEFFEVDKIVGIRANLDGEVPVVEYRVRWKDGNGETWCATGRLRARGTGSVHGARSCIARPALGAAC